MKSSAEYYAEEITRSRAEWSEWKHQQNDDERVTEHSSRAIFWDRLLSPIFALPYAWLVWRSWPIWFGQEKSTGTEDPISVQISMIITICFGLCLLTLAYFILKGSLWLIKKIL